MYSSLMLDENFELTKNSSFFTQNLKKRIGLTKSPFYLLFRNPKTRLESFYKNKILIANGHNQWEHCQKIFFNQINIYPYTTNDDKVTFFQSLTYEQFIKLLPKIYLSDPHLMPQSNAFSIKLNKVNISTKVSYDEIIDIENPRSIRKIENLTGYKFQHKNRTEDKTNLFQYTDDMQQIVNKIYTFDFEVFEKLN